MAKITRKLQKIFAGLATNNGQFGSAQTGDKVLSNDPDVIQALEAWDNGWLDATISAQKLITVEELQGIQHLVTRQLAYMFQEGIPEYSATTTYYTNSIVKKVGTYELYGSLVDDNVGNPLTDATKWGFLQNLAGTVFSTGMIMLWSGSIATIPVGWALCNGSNGTPDLRDRFVVGAKQDDSGVAKSNITGSLEQTAGSTSTSTNFTGDHSHGISIGATTLSVSQIPPHSHAVNPIVGAGGGTYQSGGNSFGGGSTGSTGGGQAHTHSASAGNSGGHQHTVTVTPPFYALAYIMKL